MMPLVKLMEYIKARITTVVNSSIIVYSEEADTDADFPYIVFKLPSSNMETLYKDKWVLEVDFWDNTGNSTNIGIASEAVKDSLHGSYQTEAEGFFRSYKIFEGIIPDDTPKIKRIQHRYEVHLY